MPRKQKDPGEAASAYLTQKALRAQLIIPCKGRTPDKNRIKAAAPTAQRPGRILIHSVTANGEQTPDIPAEDTDRDTRGIIIMAQASSSNEVSLKRPASKVEEVERRNSRKPRISTQVPNWEPGPKTKWVQTGHSKWTPCTTETVENPPEQQVDMALNDHTGPPKQLEPGRKANSNAKARTAHTPAHRPPIHSHISRTEGPRI